MLVFVTNGNYNKIKGSGKMKKFRPLFIALAVTVIEFIAFVIWGKNINPGDEMGFFLITTYFLLPVTTLVLSGYLGYKKPLFLTAFVPPMFLAQLFMPFIITDGAEFGITACLTFIPALIGAGVGMLIKFIVKKKKNT